MTAYTIIPDSSVDADSVTDAALLVALRDNELAIGEGDLTVPATARRGRHAYIYIREEQASGTSGGIAGSPDGWYPRPLNTEVHDSGSNATLASSQITLVAGTYKFNARCPFVYQLTKCRLQNITDGTTIAVGSTAWNAGERQADSVVSGMFTIPSSKVIELQYYSAFPIGTNDLGRACGFGVVEVYAEIILKRLL